MHSSACAQGWACTDKHGLGSVTTAKYIQLYCSAKNVRSLDLTVHVFGCAMDVSGGGGVFLSNHTKIVILKVREGKNAKAGAPHFQMVLWVTHKFLNPDQQNIITVPARASGAFQSVLFEILHGHLTSCFIHHKKKG